MYHLHFLDLENFSPMLTPTEYRLPPVYINKAVTLTGDRSIIFNRY